MTLDFQSSEMSRNKVTSLLGLFGSLERRELDDDEMTVARPLVVRTEAKRQPDPPEEELGGRHQSSCAEDCCTPWHRKANWSYISVHMQSVMKLDISDRPYLLRSATPSELPPSLVVDIRRHFRLPHRETGVDRPVENASVATEDCSAQFLILPVFVRRAGGIVYSSTGKGAAAEVDATVVLDLVLQQHARAREWLLLEARSMRRAGGFSTGLHPMGWVSLTDIVDRASWPNPRFRLRSRYLHHYSGCFSIYRKRVPFLLQHPDSASLYVETLQTGIWSLAHRRLAFLLKDIGTFFDSTVHLDCGVAPGEAEQVAFVGLYSAIFALGHFRFPSLPDYGELVPELLTALKSDLLRRELRLYARRSTSDQQPPTSVLFSLFGREVRRATRDDPSDALFLDRLQHFGNSRFPATGVDYYSVPFQQAGEDVRARRCLLHLGRAYYPDWPHAATRPDISADVRSGVEYWCNNGALFRLPTNCEMPDFNLRYLNSDLVGQDDGSFLYLVRAIISRAVAQSGDSRGLATLADLKDCAPRCVSDMLSLRPMRANAQRNKGKKPDHLFNSERQLLPLILRDAFCSPEPATLALLSNSKARLYESEHVLQSEVKSAYKRASDGRRFNRGEASCVYIHSHDCCPFLGNRQSCIAAGVPDIEDGFQFRFPREYVNEKVNRNN